jgi:dTMP kinase
MPLIVFEGIDGCGKTTQVSVLAERLRARALAVRQLREPGGTALGEQVRTILLAPATRSVPVAELFGYLMARAQLCQEVIAPALERAELVLLDRFYHSTLAYQAYGLGLDPGQVRAANALATGNLRPDLVLWLRLDPAQAQARRQQERGADRIEARGLPYLERVHAGYARMAGDGELTAIDAAQPPATVAEAVWAAVTARFPTLLR